MNVIRQAVKHRLDPSTVKAINAVRYVLHLAQVRLANRVLPSRYAVRRRLQNLTDVRLHWGCGQRRLDGWVNIDGWRSDATDYVHDLRAMLPFLDQSVELIFTEHALEHVEFHIAEHVLADFFRILKPGGKVRIIVPDLELCCKAFSNSDKKWFEAVGQDCLTAGDGFNQIFYSHSHRHIYDFETLGTILRRAGFTAIIRSTHLGSSDERLRLDTDVESRRLVSLYVEAVR